MQVVSRAWQPVVCVWISPWEFPERRPWADANPRRELLHFPTQQSNEARRHDGGEAGWEGRV